MKVILSVDEGKAYIQNADTNAYLEGKLEVKADLVNGKVPLEQLPSMGYTKEEILTEDTKAVFGFSAGAVPDEVFAHLGQYTQHWWSVLHGQAQTIYVEKRDESWTNNSTLAVTSTGTWNIQVADSVDVDPTTGAVALHNPKTYTVSGTSDEDGKKTLTSVIRGRYILGASFDKNNIYFIPAGMSVSYAGNVVINNNYSPIYWIKSLLTTTPEGETTYVHSSDRNAYPDSGTVSGLTYTFLGVPFNNAVTTPKIATGSYTGTGVGSNYGSNPVTLAFDFPPKFIWVYGESYHYGFMFFHGETYTTSGLCKVVGGYEYNVYCKRVGNTVYWYADGNNTDNNFNSTCKYHYIAVG